MLIASVNLLGFRSMSASTEEKPASTPKRDHLLSTAFKLFNRDGYHAVGIDTILAEAKLAKMTLYHHFASKEELIIAALEQRGGQIRVGLQTALAEAGNSPRKKFLAIFDWYEWWFTSRDFYGCAFIRAVAEYPQIESPIHQAVMAHKLKLITTLVGLLTELEVAVPETLARQVYLLLEGAIVGAHTFGDASTAKSAKAAALALLKAANTKPRTNDKG